MNVGVDVGYYAVKVVHLTGKFTIPSVVGTPEKSTFRLTEGQGSSIIVYNGRSYNVGQAVIDQSRMSVRREDRDWFNSDEYMVLLYAALAELPALPPNLLIVTGLPVAYFEADKDELQQRFEGIHQIEREGHPAITVNVSKCFVTENQNSCYHSTNNGYKNPSPPDS